MTLNPDLFIKLIEQIRYLVNYRGAANRTFFVDHVDPIYQNLRIVVEDYRSIFEQAAADLSNPDIPIESVVNGLIEQRKKHAVTREEVVAAANIVREQKNASDDIQRFCEHSASVVSKAPSAKESDIYDPLLEKTGFSEVLGLVSKLENLNRREAPRDQFIEEAMFVLADVEIAWKNALEAYYKLRVACLKHTT